LRTISCPYCEKNYVIEYNHFFGKICECGFEIPSDGDVKLVKENKIKDEETKQKALDSIKRKFKL